jgi:hypothetical protein
MLLRQIIFFILLVIVGHAHDLVFILQDAGETQALLPVLERLEKEKKEFIVLAGGVAKEQLQGKIWAVPLPLEKSCPRTEKLSKLFLQEIVAKYPAKKVVTGVAFEFQGEFLETYGKEGAKTFAYWDNINFEGSDSYFVTAQKVAKIAQTVLVPTKMFEHYFPHAVVVGQPSLERWKSNLGAINPQAVRARLPFLKSGKPVALFVGGYGKEYEEAFDLFLSTASVLKEYDIIVSFHPKMGGNFERPRLPSSIHLLETTYGVSTQEAVAIADLVLCHQSTVGVQAAVSGKKVVHLIPKGQSYTNPAIENHLAQVASSANEVQPTSVEIIADPFQVLGVPTNSVDRIYSILSEK